jgi:protein-S-isoprenylcysteine O-methyltransferase Ste14
MPAGPEFRLAIAYLLLLRLILIWVLGPRAARSDLAGAHERTPWYDRSMRLLVQGLFLLPASLWALTPSWLAPTQIDPHPGFRWLALIPAAAALLLQTWAEVSRRRSGEKNAAEVRLSTGPYRLIRYPGEVSQVTFYAAIAWLTANTVPLVSALLGGLIVRYVLVARQETRRRERTEEVDDPQVRRSGVFLPDLGPAAHREYTVPKRFGMAAIVALVTVLAIAFGALKYWDAHPAIYLFVSSEIVAVCLAQIIFGNTPRGACALTGATLLPFWLLLTSSRPTWLGMELYVLVIVLVFLFGGLLGYCLGALAAGFFLVTDLLETWFEQRRAREEV